MSTILISVSGGWICLTNSHTIVQLPNSIFPLEIVNYVISLCALFVITSLTPNWSVIGYWLLRGVITLCVVFSYYVIDCVECVMSIFDISYFRVDNRDVVTKGQYWRTDQSEWHTSPNGLVRNVYTSPVEYKQNVSTGSPETWSIPKPKVSPNPEV